MRMQLALPGGTLKIKTRGYVREVERSHLPVFRFGPLYLIWWSKMAERMMGRRGG